MNNSQRKFLDDKIIKAKRLLNEVINNCRQEIPLDLLEEIEDFIANKNQAPSIGGMIMKGGEYK
jgi:GTPase Era involved in 16S rRNA processing